LKGFAVEMALPDAPSVQENLDKVLRSETFSRSERARALLFHLVQMQLSGESSRLKGAVIAVEMFQKDVADQSTGDSVVRVQVGRLRELLARYYQSEGQHDAVRIAIARGSYVPHFSFAVAENRAQTDVASDEPKENGAQVPSQAAPAVSAWRFPQSLARPIGVALALAFGTVLFTYAAPKNLASTAIAVPASPSHGGIELAALFPAVSVVAHSSKPHVTGVVDLLHMALPGFDAVDFFDDQSSASQSPAALDGLGFVFDVLDGMQPGSVQIKLRHAASGQILATSILQPGDLEPCKLNERMTTILSSTVTVTGSIYAFASENANAHELMRCLQLFAGFLRQPAEEKHKSAYLCFDGLAEKNIVSPLILSQRASLMAQAVRRQYAFPADASLERALEMAQAAVQLGPVSAVAHRDLSYVYESLGRYGETLRWARRAYELNPFNWSTIAGHARGLMLTGQYLESAELMEAVFMFTPSHPDSWDMTLFYDNLMMGNKTGIMKAAASVDSEADADFLAAKIIAAYHCGDRPKLVGELMERLHKNFPEFANNPEASMERLRMPKRIIDRVVDNLLEAGLQQGS